MPALSRLRSTALEDLAQQLRFSSPATILRQIERIEALAPDLDPAQTYPEDWLVFRITGYRAQIAAPAMFVGAALLADLSALAERLCDAARFDSFEDVLDLPGLCARWGVSRKTIERYRRRGLIARRVRDAGRARTRLVFHVEHAAAFERARAGDLGEAGRFTRMSAQERSSLIESARTLHEREGWSLNRAARALAREHGRAHETVRQVLRRHDARAGEGHGAIFGERGPAGARERAFIERAFFWGFWPEEIARRVDRPVTAVRRVIHDARAMRLRSLGLRAQADRTTDPRVLDHPSVCEGLGKPGASDLLELVRGARRTPPPDADAERARSEAYHLLVSRASLAIAGLSDHGASATALEEIERDLRWAARVKTELIRAQLGTMARTLDSVLGRPLEDVRSAALIALMGPAIGAAGAGVDAFEPAHGGRLAGAVVLGVTRMATAWQRTHAEELGGTRTGTRAASILGSGVRIADWTRHVCAWQSWRGSAWLEPPARARDGLDRLNERDREVLERRYGLGPRPHTLAELAAFLGLPLVKAVGVVRGAERDIVGSTGIRADQ